MNEENKESFISFNSNVFADGYGQQNVDAYATSTKLYRAVTRSESLQDWWSFDRDSLRTSSVQSGGMGGRKASIYDAWVSPKGKFGQGLAYNKTSLNGRMKIEPNGIELEDSGWTITLWCKNIIPPKHNGKTTLFRGQDKQNGLEFDHYLSFREADQLLGFIDGDEEDQLNNFKDFGYVFGPSENMVGILVLLGEGGRIKFFLNGILLGRQM